MFNNNPESLKLLVENISKYKNLISINKLVINPEQNSIELSFKDNRPSLIPDTVMDARLNTTCEICGNPINPGIYICKGVYHTGDKTENFIHTKCCKSEDSLSNILLTFLNSPNS